MRLNCDYCGKSSFVRRARIVAACAFIPLILAACGEEKTVELPVRPVKAMIVPKPAMERVLTYSGVIAPRIETTLGFRVSGKIIERYVNVGDKVRAAEKIARLDEKDLKLAENSARATLESAKTRLSVAKDALNRAKFLLPNGFIAQAAVDQRQLEFDSAQAALNAAQDQLGQAINATSYALLRADKDGIVTSVRAEPGQVVSAGQAVITLALAGNVEALVAVPEQEIVKLKEGNPSVISLWSAPEIKGEGKIREIAGAADPASRTYAVRVAIAKPVDAMRIGMTAQVAFNVPEDAPGVIVPLAALSERDGKTIAFVADRETQTVAQRHVIAGAVTGDGVRVKSGIRPGDIVVTGGVQFLQDGMKVRLPAEVLTSVAQADLEPSHR